MSTYSTKLNSHKNAPSLRERKPLRGKIAPLLKSAFYGIILITSTKNCAQNKVAILYFSYEGFLITVINWIKKEYSYFYIFQHGQTLHPCLLSVTCRFANKSRVLKAAFIFRTKSPLAKTKTE